MPWRYDGISYLRGNAKAEPSGAGSGNPLAAVHRVAASVPLHLCCLKCYWPIYPFLLQEDARRCTIPFWSGTETFNLIEWLLREIFAKKGGWLKFAPHSTLLADRTIGGCMHAADASVRARGRQQNGWHFIFYNTSNDNVTLPARALWFRW